MPISIKVRSKNRMNQLHDTGLAPYHTFGIDAQASMIIEATSAEDFITLWQDPAYSQSPKLVVGQGSNLLFCEDYQGIVVLNRLKGIDVSEDAQAYHLHVAGGEDWHQLVKWTVENNMPGLENLALIPGCVGSSPIQNIGAYGKELKDLCEYVDVLNVLTGKISRLSAAECLFGYRDSIFKHQLKDDHIIIAVGLTLSKDWQPQIGYGPLAQFDLKTVTAKEIFDTVCNVRLAKLPNPKELGNAGSFFKNPVISKQQAQKLLAEHSDMPSYPAGDEIKLAAGWLIDQCGLKGFTIGGAKVHEQQALVLVNTGSASAQDVMALAQHVVSCVYEQFGVELEHEVRFMAKSSETCLAKALQ